MFNRHQVYMACLLAESNGVDCMAFGNACDRSNKGQYRSEFYQSIASEYYNPSLDEDQCWEIYQKARQAKATA